MERDFEGGQVIGSNEYVNSCINPSSSIAIH